MSSTAAGAAAAAAPPGHAVPDTSAIDQYVGDPVHDTSSIDQYVEAIPTSSGPDPTGRTRAQAQPLPPQVASDVREQAGQDAEALFEIAESPTYGAPLRSRTKDPDEGGEIDSGGTPQPSPFDAVVSPVAEADEPRLLGLLGLLGGMTLFAFAFARRQQR